MTLLQRIRRWIEFKQTGSVAWWPSNIYPTAIIGRNVSIGMFSEIGDGVEIGDNTRIGMGCFIPKGTYIGREVFIGPKVCFVHDMYPAIDSPKSEWLVTTVGFRASIGANALIRPGVNIGNRALIGLGSVVTKDIPAGQIWSGNPARFVRNR